MIVRMQAAQQLIKPYSFINLFSLIPTLNFPLRNSHVKILDCFIVKSGCLKAGIAKMILQITASAKECLIRYCLEILALGAPEGCLFETHQLVVSVLMCKVSVVQR